MKDKGIHDESGEGLLEELMTEWNRLDRVVQPISDLSENAWEQRIEAAWLEKKRLSRRDSLIFFLISLAVIGGGGLFAYKVPYLFVIVQGVGMAVALGVVAIAVLFRKEKSL
ncbi:YxlC family protein [Fontibacillus sp. BL9]|uniref:YxlC family protein n=1 Tax=Fontibacillus sp. BL9 TaxID=3389971 RepID=UPI0039796A17